MYWRENEARLNRIRWAAAARRASAGILAVALLGVCGVGEIRAQDAAEAARLEQARKDALTKHAKHVYTEEDLARARILTPEDRAQLEAKQQQAPQDTTATEVKAEPAIEHGEAAPSVSLGEIARAYRAQKALTELEHGGDFHLQFENPILAAPVVPVRPLVKATAPRMAQPQFLAPLNAEPVLRPIQPAQPTAAPRVPVRPPVKATAPRMAQPQFLAPTLNAEPVMRPIQPAQPTAAPRVPVRPPVKATAPRMAQPQFLAPTLNAEPVLRPIQPTQPTHTIESIRPPQAPLKTLEGRDSVTVQRGDSLWKLAEKNLGAASRWRDLLAANPAIVNPSYIQQGAQILLPTASTEQRRSSVTVQKGDTLWSIARRWMARASLWSCIARSNRQITNADRIYAGQVLSLPAQCDNSQR
jgi:nucleoid-associated protein YgaU